MGIEMVCGHIQYDHGCTVQTTQLSVAGWAILPCIQSHYHIGLAYEQRTGHWLLISLHSLDTISYGTASQKPVSVYEPNQAM